MLKCNGWLVDVSRNMQSICFSRGPCKRGIKFNLGRDAFITEQKGPGRCPSPNLGTCNCILYGCKNGGCWNAWLIRLESDQASILHLPAHKIAGHFRKWGNVRSERWGGQGSKGTLSALRIKEPQSQESGWLLEKENGEETDSPRLLPERSTTLWVPSHLQNCKVIVFQAIIFVQLISAAKHNGI